VKSRALGVLHQEFRAYLEPDLAGQQTLCQWKQVLFFACEPFQQILAVRLNEYAHARDLLFAKAGPGPQHRSYPGQNFKAYTAEMFEFSQGLARVNGRRAQCRELAVLQPALMARFGKFDQLFGTRRQFRTIEVIAVSWSREAILKFLDRSAFALLLDS
jgi:hypothetical protein